LPEALLCTDIASAKALETELDWADAVVIGPGLSKSDNAKMLVETVLKTAEIPLVIDADALNIISDNMTLLNEHKMPVIVTPHLGEMSRLMKKSIANIQEDIIGVAGDFAAFARLVEKSGHSSFECCQNVYCASSPKHQGLSAALAAISGELA